MRPFVTLASLLFSGVVLPTSLAASEPVSVEVRLVDGRHVFGIVDQQTDSQMLWLRSTDVGIVLRSGHSWNVVAHVRHGDSVVSGDMMQNTTMSLRSLAESIPVDPRVVTSTDRPDSAKGRAKIDQRIRAVKVDAVHANYDRDARSDGLRLVISPINSDSDVIASDAIVEVELIGEHHSPTHARQRFVRLGRWTRSVKAEQFSVDGVSVHLPYRQFRPGRDLDVLSDGFVQIRFKVAGVGSFEAVDPWVRLRPSSPVLNRYQLHTGHRSRAFGQQRNPARTRPIQRY